MPKNKMEIDLRILRYSEKIARAYSAIAQNATLWKYTFNNTKTKFHVKNMHREILKYIKKTRQQ